MVLLLVYGGFALGAQASQQSVDQSQSDSTKKKTQKKKKADTASADASSSPATSTAPASRAAPAATPASSGGGAPTVSIPTSKAAARPPAPPADSAGMVWVNTDSGIYHKPGTRWYGKTKQGKYMTEADAQKAGYRAAEKE